MERHRGRDIGLAILAAVAVALAAVAAAPLFSQGGSGDSTSHSDSSFERPSVEDLEAAEESNGPFGPVVVLFSIVYRLWQILSAHVLKFQLTRLEPVEVPGRGPSESLNPRAPTTEPTPNASDGLGQGAGDAPLLDGTGIVLVATGALVLVVLLATRYDVVQSVLGLTSAEADSDSDDLHAVGRVAGDAADRMAAASTPEAAENAVYSAWSEMVALLDAPDPRSGTPRQFAASAVDAGMDPDDVAMLTETFEAVRYGGASPSAERRERATEAFRRIEAEYASDDESGGPSQAPHGHHDRDSEPEGVR